LDESSYRDYTGVDISEVALDKARRRTEENGRGEKCRFIQGDVMTYTPDKQFDVVLFRDSIYYIKRPRIKATLMRYAHWLKDSGVFIVRIWDGRGKLRQFIEILESHFDIVEGYRHEESDAVVLVFKCRAGVRAD
jgi:2-polyprenyl-6-hydroxyphenyl methylase/3-demethylubiquinone-9 3-methyltransferase